MVEVDIDDRIGVSGLAWNRLPAVDVGVIAFGRVELVKLTIYDGLFVTSDEL